MRCRYCRIGEYFTCLRCDPSSELMGGSNDENPYVVIPDTDEYYALGFLVRNRENDSRRLRLPPAQT